MNRPRDCQSSVSSRSSTAMDEDKHYLLSDGLDSEEQLYSRKGRWQSRVFSWNTTFLVANVVILVVGVAVWVRVNTMLKGFSCESRADIFEPDRG